MAEKILVETKLVNEELVGSSIVTNIIDLNELDFKNPKESPIKTAVIKGPKGDDPYNLMKYINDFYAAGYKPENEQDIIEIIAAQAFERLGGDGRNSAIYKRAESMNFYRQDIQAYQKINDSWEKTYANDLKKHLPTKLVITNITAPMKASYNETEYTAIDEESKTLTIEFPDGFSKGDHVNGQIEIYGLDGNKKRDTVNFRAWKTPLSEEMPIPKGLENKDWQFDTETQGWGKTYAEKPYIISDQAQALAVIKSQLTSGYLYFPNATVMGVTSDYRQVDNIKSNVLSKNKSSLGLSFKDDTTAPFVVNMPNVQLEDKDEKAVVGFYQGGYDTPLKAKLRIICKRGTGEKTAELLTKAGLTKHETSTEKGLEVEDWYNESLWEKSIEEYFKEEA